MIDDISPLVARLPDPPPPPALAVTVMARIAREAELKETGVPRPHPERPAWLWAVAGLALVLCTSAWGWFAAGSPPDLMTPRIGRGSPALLPAEWPVALVLALGLLLYLAGLFAPLRGSGRRQGRGRRPSRVSA